MLYKIYNSKKDFCNGRKFLHYSSLETHFHSYGMLFLCNVLLLKNLSWITQSHFSDDPLNIN